MDLWPKAIGDIKGCAENAKDVWSVDIGPSHWLLFSLIKLKTKVMEEKTTHSEKQLTSTNEDSYPLSES